MKKQKEIATNKSILDIITPIEINFKRNSLEIGDYLAKTYGVIKYTPEVSLGWLAGITNLNNAIVNITFTPNNNSELIEAISRNINHQRGDLNTTKDYIKKQQAESGIENSENIIRMVDQYGEMIGYFSLLIMAVGADEKSLVTACKEVEARIAGLGFGMRCLSNLQIEGYETMSPFHLPNPKISNITNTIMPLSTTVLGQPISAVDFSDDLGFYFGRDSMGGVIFLDIWNRQGDRANSNWVVLGEPGQGKSFLIKHIISEEFATSDIKIYILDPENEYTEMTKEFGGDVINAGGGPKGKINPLQVKCNPKEDDEGISDVALHLKTVEAFFDLYLPDISSDERSLLQNAIVDVYKMKNIDFATDVTQLKNDDFPIMQDLYHLVCSNEDEVSKKLAGKLKNIAVGADSFLWNGCTEIKSDKQIVCLNTHNLQNNNEKTKKTQYFNILTWVWEQASKNRDERCIIVCDESYLMIDNKVPQAITFLRNIAKRGRKYNVSLMVISHSVVDFLSPEIKHEGQEILGNATYKVFFGCDGKSEKELAELYNLKEAEREFILSKQKANALVTIGSKRLKVNFDLGYKSEFLTGGGK
jgi:type IV secretory pathway VirB4 component